MWYLKNYFKGIHVVFKVTRADICKCYEGTLQKVVRVELV